MLATKVRKKKKEQEADHLVITPAVEVLYEHYRYYRISPTNNSNLSIPFFVLSVLEFSQCWTKKVYLLGAYNSAK